MTTSTVTIHEVPGHFYSLVRADGSPVHGLWGELAYAVRAAAAGDTPVVFAGLDGRTFAVPSEVVAAARAEVAGIIAARGGMDAPNHFDPAWAALDALLTKGS